MANGNFKQYEKKNGTKAWLINSLYLGLDEYGKQVRVTRRGFDTLKEAKKEATRLKTLFDRGEYGKQQKECTFKEVFELWFESYSKTVKEVTSMGTYANVTKHFMPTLGHIKISKVTPAMAQKEVNRISKSRKTYKYVVQYVKTIFKFAMSLEMIDRNPFENVIYPKSTVEVKEKEVKFYTTDQIKLIMDTLENDVKQSANLNIGKQYRALLTLALYRTLAFSGMRVSEACALTWSDIDFLNNTITINKTLSKAKKGRVVSSPKTKSSNRTLAMDPKTMRILRQWQFKQKELLFANGLTNIDNIFTQWHGKTLNANTVLDFSERVAKKCGLPFIGTHGYRHSHASMLFESNVSMKEAQVRLGHSNIEMTMNIYTHVTNEAQTKTVEKLTKFANF